MTAAVATAPVRGRGGLRLRVTAGFAVGGLVLVGVLSLVTYFVADHYLVRQRERSLRHQAEGDARVFEAEVARGLSVPVVLEALDRLPNSDVFALVDGTWYRTSSVTGMTRPPAPVRAGVAGGETTQELIRGSGAPVFVVGIPIPSIHAQYYESSRLVELHSTLRIIRSALIAGGVLAVILGGLGGFWLSRRVLLPVSEFATAARRVAAGDLETRLEHDKDRYLDSLATSFNEMVDSIDDRIQREARFVADASHELRSPITTLATSMEILATSDLELPPESRPAFELLELEVDHLRQLVEDLLELGRADAGVEQLELSAVELGEFMRQAIDPVHTESARLVIADDLAEQRVLVDKRRLERVLANLIANAKTHGDGLRSVVVTRHDDSLRVEVEDNGSGVDPADRGAVFTRFYRGAAAGRRRGDGGSGLGLSLVAEHVKLHGGSVSIEDARVGAGARFVVEIPWLDP